MAEHDSFPVPARVRNQLDVAGQEFLAGLYRQETQLHPQNVSALAELAHALTRLGRLEEGLEADRQLLRLIPENPTVHYNLACSLCLLGQPDGALDALEKAVELGYDDAEHLVQDQDLSALHDELRFQRLVRRLEAAAADVSSP